MAISDIITLGTDKEIVRVDADPTTSGVAAPIGSVALLNLSGAGAGYVKIGSSNTAWDKIVTASMALTNPLTTLGDTIYGGAAGIETRLAGNITAVKQFLSQTGTGTVSAAPSWAALVSGDIPNNAANTSGTASNVTATSNSTIVTLSALSLPGSQVTGNIPGNAANVTGTVAIANGGTGQTTAAAAFNALSPLTTLGDSLYGGASGAGTRLAGNTSAVKQFLSQTGTGTVSAAPVWGGLVSGDIPNNAANTSGTAANITATSNSTLTTLSALSLPVAQLTGTLPIANGGTNSATALANNQLMWSAAGKIVEAGALTNGQIFIGSTGAAPTTLATIATASDQMICVEAHIVARRTGGTAGTADDSAVFKKTIVIKNIAGTVTVPLVQSDFTYADQILWSVVAIVSTTNVLIQVVGATNNNVTWNATTKVQTV